MTNGMRRLAATTSALVLCAGATVPAVLADTVTSELAPDAEPAPGGTFTDDDGSVHEGYIEAIAALEVTRGCDATGTRFCPGAAVTRGQMAAFLVRSLGLEEVGDLRFEDVAPGSTFAQAIDRLATAGITRGCDATGTRFCPDEPVSRQQMAAFLTRGFALASDTEIVFADVPTDAPFAADVSALASSGITTGCDATGTRFCPHEQVTRGQMATFLGRALDADELIPPPRPRPLQHGNPAGSAPIPPEGRLRDTSNPDQVIGSGTPASCTSAAVVEAVARGGVIVFDCGPDPVRIVMDVPAKVVNDAAPEVIIDGGGLVTLDGGDRTRILYLNTCDPAQVWTTPHCQDQDHPRLTVQNLTFEHGAVGGTDLVAGGGAIFARGGQLTVINAAFRNNTCAPTGPDVGGGAIRAFDQYRDRPVHVVRSTFGGAADHGNACSNGGALSSIGVSWVLTNSLLTHNRAIGEGANPARPGTPGGGNGGAVALDGNTFTLQVHDSVLHSNHANEGGGAIFFVSNDRSGTLSIDGSTLRSNVSAGFETAGYPGIFYLGAGPPLVTDSTLEP